MNPISYLKLINTKPDVAVTIVEKCIDHNKDLQGVAICFEDADEKDIKQAIYESKFQYKEHIALMFDKRPITAFTIMLKKDTSFSNFTDYFIAKYGSVDAIFEALNKTKVDAYSESQQISDVIEEVVKDENSLTESEYLDTSALTAEILDDTSVLAKEEILDSKDTIAEETIVEDTLAKEETLDSKDTIAEDTIAEDTLAEDIPVEYIPAEEPVMDEKNFTGNVTDEDDIPVLDMMELKQLIKDSVAEVLSSNRSDKNFIQEQIKDGIQESSYEFVNDIKKFAKEENSKNVLYLKNYIDLSLNKRLDKFTKQKNDLLSDILDGISKSSSDIKNTIKDSVNDPLDKDLTQCLTNTLSSNLDKKTNDITEELSKLFSNSIEQNSLIVSDKYNIILNEKLDGFKTDIMNTLQDRFKVSLDIIIDSTMAAVTKIVNESLTSSIEKQESFLLNLRDSLSEELNNSLSEELNNSLSVALDASLPVALDTSLPLALDASLPLALDASLPVALDASLPVALDASLSKELDTSLSKELDTSLPVALDASFKSFNDHLFNETSGEIFELLRKINEETKMINDILVNTPEQNMTTEAITDITKIRDCVYELQNSLSGFTDVFDNNMAEVSKSNTNLHEFVSAIAERADLIVDTQSTIKEHLETLSETVGDVNSNTDILIDSADEIKTNLEKSSNVILKTLSDDDIDF